MTPGSDSWAVRDRYISVTPLDLMQDFAFSPEHLARGHRFVSIAWEIMESVSTQLGMVADRNNVSKL